MQFYYGDMMPLRILDEAEFWKRQETEHTVVIRQIAPGLELQYIEALRKWEESFAETEGKVVKYVETVVRSGPNIPPQTHQEIMQLIHFSQNQSQQFVMLLNQLLTNSKAIADNQIAITVINHIRRESEYYIGIVHSLFDRY
ncbi:DUF2935 domain-containing protein [Tepidibacillus decaturensis]|uniref:DUF2935 domain-containing protein n=1 Tax=Tepidibacillus decaturensis TaxID=1413211 RepID=A0A135L3L4_9BACI|nr:DUF2935 domain-containing protein [Tepidibacillus decaturensis]KXG43531.1 hypothetical protein U473_05505 [Tepidibacillus decaturensis]